MPAIYSNNRLMKLSPFVGVNAIYDTGLSPIVSNADGNIVRRSAVGSSLAFGISGSRPYRRSLLSLGYSGNLTHYPNIDTLTFFNQSLNLGFSHAVSRKLRFESINSGQMMNNALGLGFGMQTGLDFTTDSTNGEVFNSPTYSLMTQQQITYQKSVRLGITLGGGGFTTFRRSSALVGVKGATATGTAFYRLSARTTLGGNYNFGQFNFANSSGTTNFHTVGVELSHKFTRRSEVALSVGATRVESQSLRRVPFDPLLALLFGRPFGVESIYQKNYIPNFQFRVSQGTRSWNFSAEARRVMNQGNGLVLGNMMTAVGGRASYTGIRKATFSVSGEYSELKGFLGTVRGFRGYSGTVSGTYNLGRGLSWTAGFSARQFDVGDAGINNPLFSRTQYRVMTGLRWSPSSVPIPFF